MVRAFDQKLSNAEKGVFKKLPKAFGKAPDVNIIANFSDDAEPLIKHALVNEKIPHADIFKLNTMFVESGNSNFDEFLEYLDSCNSCETFDTSRSRQVIGNIRKRWGSVRRRFKSGSRDTT